MADEPAPRGVQSANADRLDSWKAIATYLKRDVSTVQRWEKRERLPVHRHSKGGSVYAFQSELDAWWRDDGRRLEGDGRAPPTSEPAPTLRIRGLLLIAAATAIISASALFVRSRPDRPRLHSLAVLPLANLTGDTHQDYFVDGMTDALTAELGRIRGLRVISRQSMTRYKHMTKTVPEIAGELHIDGVVQGSVMRDADRVRVSVTLIEGPTDRHLWAGSFEADAKDVLAVHRDISRAIGAEMRLATSGPDGPPPQRVADIRAYEHYLRGRVHCGRWSADGFVKGVDELETAIALDPGYAPSYAALASCYGSANNFGHRRPGELSARRKAAVAKALELAPDSGEAQRVAGAAAFRLDLDWSGAEAAFRRAISIEPNNSLARQGYAWYLAALGRSSEALEQVDEARRLDPVSVQHLLASGTVALFSGRFDRAVEECRKAVLLEPGSVVARAYLGWALLLEGQQTQQALEELETANRLASGDPFAASLLGYGYGTVGREGDAQKILADLRALSGRRYVSPFFQALVHTALGESDAALDQLERAYEERNEWLVWLKVDQRLDPLRTNPRFQALLARIHFPD